MSELQLFGTIRFLLYFLNKGFSCWPIRTVFYMLLVPMFPIPSHSKFQLCISHHCRIRRYISQKHRFSVTSSKRREICDHKIMSQVCSMFNALSNHIIDLNFRRSLFAPLMLILYNKHLYFCVEWHKHDSSSS